MARAGERRDDFVTPSCACAPGFLFCPPYGSGASSPAASATYEKWEGDPMARPDKVAAVAELKEKFSSADATVLTEYLSLIHI